MERVHFAVLAIVVAVLAFAVLRLVADDPVAEHFATDVVPGMQAADAAQRRRLPLSGERADRRDGPGRTSDDGGARVPGERGGAASRPAGGSPQLIADAPGARGGIATGGGRVARGGTANSATLADVLAGGLAARVPGAPQPRGARELELPERAPAGRQTLEFVDDDASGGDTPLLSIPFQGDVDPETGGAPSEASGLLPAEDGVEFPDDARLTFPAGGHVNGSAGTISFEIEPAWAGSDPTNQSMVQIRNEHVWENTLQIVKNYNSLRFIIIDEGGIERNLNVIIDDWLPGDAHTVTATWGEEQMSLYVDGGLIGQTPLPNGLRFLDSTPIHIGSDFPGTAYSGAGATIRDFQVYGRALSTDEVTRQ